MKLGDLVRSMRPHQWYKNLVILACIPFSLNLFNPDLWARVLSAFVIFCMLSGSTYIINDIFDRDRDRLHPVKQSRPIASNALRWEHALIFSCLLMALASIWAYIISPGLFVACLCYLFLTLSYSAVLKHIMIADVLAISIGFVIRAAAGCLAGGVFISPWLIICTFLLALFMAIGKRYAEISLMGDLGREHRASLESYSKVLVDQMLSVTTASLVISYSLYTFLADDPFMMFTIPFVVYGLFRYLHLVYNCNAGGDPEMILRDRGMIANLILWILLVISLLYMQPFVPGALL